MNAIRLLSLCTLIACTTPEPVVHPGPYPSDTLFAPRCGDGKVETGKEACDDGNAINTDACTNACKVAVCGDGIVWDQHEGCDEGKRNGVQFCSSDCRALTANDLAARDEREAITQPKINTLSGAKLKAMKRRYKAPSVAPCFPAGSSNQPHASIIKEVARHFGLPQNQLTATLKDLDRDGRKEWFVHSAICSGPFGCLGSVFIPSTCAPKGWCYAHSGHRGPVSAQGPYRCRSRLVAADGGGLLDPSCAFEPAHPACVRDEDEDEDY
jgi:cysteine-rich repeat protein